MRLVDIIAQNIEFKNKPLEELDELSLKSFLKDEVYLILKTNIQKMKQIDEIFSELDITYQILNKISDEECTNKESNKKILLTAYTMCSKMMFMKVQEKIRAETNELLGGILKIEKE